MYTLLPSKSIDKSLMNSSTWNLQENLNGFVSPGPSPARWALPGAPVARKSLMPYNCCNYQANTWGRWPGRCCRTGVHMGWRAPPSRRAIPSEDLGRSGTEGVPVTSWKSPHFTFLKNHVEGTSWLWNTGVSITHFASRAPTVKIL